MGCSGCADPFWERTVGSPNIDTGRSVAPKPPVVVRAAFQFVSTHLFYFYLPFPSIPAGDERWNRLTE